MAKRICQINGHLPMSLSDLTLLDQISGGSRDALAEFYDRHAARVFGLLRRWLAASDAEDVLQEVFWQVWQSAGRFDPMRGPPSTWLLMIARSRATDQLRRPKLNLAGSDLGCEQTVQVNPAANLERDEMQCQVADALARLPAEQRTAIELAFFGGLTSEQIARRQETPLGTIKTRIRLGMRRLRGILRTEGTSVR